jgi:hypothetical protein
VAGNDGLVRLILLSLCRWDYLIEDRDHKDRGLTHTGLGLAKDILALESERDGLNLHFTRMLETALPDCALELILEEEFVPTGEIGSLVSLVGVDFGFLLLIGAFVVSRHKLVHDSLF